MSSVQVLLVEDDKNQARTLAKILSLEGFETLTAHSGRLALAHIQERPFDVIISDLRLGDIDGMGVFREVNKSCPEVPFILMTAHRSGGRL